MKNLDPTIASNKDKWKKGTYKVIIKFVVEKNGTLKDITTTNYKSSATALHCIAIMKKSPNWKSALNNGRKVVSYRLQPITFMLVD